MRLSTSCHRRRGIFQPMNPIRILVIDDDDAMRRLAVTVLAFEGYDVSAAQNAESARQEMARRLPDIVLMDR
ncbi:MAG: response regulator, partial [Gemmatimonadota bacterium]|nr:response regulator [Gemmatimonadota bacterium]